MAHVKPIPEGYHALTPYLIVDGAAAAIDFYKKAFGATELVRMPGANGRIGHAEIKIGDSPLMLADEDPTMGYRSPRSIGGNSISLLLYVEDCDAVVERAVKAGAKITRPVADQFYGDRTGGIEDPFGHTWYVATHIKDVSHEEMKKVMEEKSRETEAAGARK
jgi:PhnB protein